MIVDQNSYEWLYSQVLADLKQIATNAISLRELTQNSVELVKDRLDFLFVGIAFLDASKTSIRRYMGTDNLFVKRTMFISIDDENNPVAFALRTGRSRLIHVTEEVFKNPHFPDEKVEFYLPLMVNERNFGTVEIFSPRDSDWEEVSQYYPLLENLVSQVASACVKWTDDENIEF